MGGMEFSNESELKEHEFLYSVEVINITARRKQDYPCDNCNMSLFYNALLDKDMKMIHKKRKLENS